MLVCQNNIYAFDISQPAILQVIIRFNPSWTVSQSVRPARPAAALMDCYSFGSAQAHPADTWSGVGSVSYTDRRQSCIKYHINCGIIQLIVPFLYINTLLYITFYPHLVILNIVFNQILVKECRVQLVNHEIMKNCVHRWQYREFKFL